jgi:signal transduction histidine kinase
VAICRRPGALPRAAGDFYYTSKGERLSTRRRLSQLLVASHLGALLVFALMVAVSGLSTIRTAVVGQARTEAERALTEARKQLFDWRRELTVAADLLAEQPTLRFYLETDQLTKARSLVRDFHGTSGLGSIEVEYRGKVVASTGDVPPHRTTGLGFDTSGKLWRVLRREIASLPEASIIVADRLEDRLRPASSFVRVRVQPVVGNDEADDPAWKAVVSAVAESGEPMTVEAVGEFAAARLSVLGTADNVPPAVLSASVGSDWVEGRIIEWYTRLAVAIAVAFAVAFSLAILVAGRIGKPFAAIADEAERLGSGDLGTSVAPPRTFLAEPLRLADSLETMRQQVGAAYETERRHREELDTVLNGVDEGIAAVDDEETIHYANLQFADLVGLPRASVLGSRLEAIIAPLEYGQPNEGAHAALPAFERFSTKDGARSLVVRRLPTGARPKVIIVREENALEAARAMRDRILANLSHEFQTPLSAQIASIELLRDHLQAANDKIANRLVDAQYRGTVRLAQLVENLLDSVRVESGEMRLRQQRVQLDRVIEDALALMKPLTDLRDQQVVCALDPGSGLLLGDSQRLHSVMVNLLANANKFSHTGSTIWVEMETDETSVSVWVEDEGPGLPPSLTVRDLFAPFRRAPHEEPSQRGTGLGLAIVHAIVAAHGGRVQTAAPKHASGARFGFSLPKAAEA